PDGIWPPPSIWRVGYQKNYTVMNNPAGAATDDIRSFVAVEYRYATASAPAVKIDHPFGKDPEPVAAFFRDLADAQAEANRRLALYRIGRGYYAFDISDRAGSRLNVGDQIWVQHPRGDLKLGRYMLIVSIHHQAKAHKVTIEAYG
ncbi:MAG: hypothetical protein MK097_03850, partial [Dechloromonas sp.]|nr:hypothetical protein [Dechloromonas sp.]